MMVQIQDMLTHIETTLLYLYSDINIYEQLMSFDLGYCQLGPTRPV
jgi:hypothetical protein